MKFLLTLFVFVANIGNAQTIKTTGQLIDFAEIKMPAYCGYQIEYSILKVKIIKGVSYLKTGDTIYIFQTCPRETMEREVGAFLNNNQYQLSIRKQISKSEIVKADKILKRDYPNELPTAIYHGTLSKLK